MDNAPQQKRLVDFTKVEFEQIRELLEDAVGLDCVEVAHHDALLVAIRLLSERIEELPF